MVFCFILIQLNLANQHCLLANKTNNFAYHINTVLLQQIICWLVTSLMIIMMYATRYESYIRVPWQLDVYARAISSVS